MSGSCMMVLSKDPALRKMFRSDPLGAIKILERQCNNATRLTSGDIELIQSLSDEEFEMLYGVVDKMKQLDIPNFKL